MHKILATALVLGLAYQVSAQADIQWATKVENSSGQAHNDRQQVENVLGLPNAMPQGGDHPDAWELKDSDNEYVQLRFEKAQPITRVIVLENNNPGSLTRIIAYEPGGKEHELKKMAPAKLKETKRTFILDFPLTAYPVEQIRLEFNTKAIPYPQQIDAVGISGRQGQLSLIQLPPDLDVNAKPERLSNAINSPFAELGPVISPDGQRLYFSRRFHPGNVGGTKDREDIWYADAASNGTWGQAKNMGRPLNNESYNFVSSVTPDGNMLLVGNVYLDDGTMDAGASYSIRTDTGWSDPDPIKIRQDKNRSQKVDYFLSASGRALIISEERPGGYGSRDLYICFQNEEGIWSEPDNMGPEVNTASDEYAPFLAADARTLYFSTSGRPGYGNDDIFVTRRIGNEWKSWSHPENLGRPINTPGKDAYFTLPARGNYAYYTSAGLKKDAEETDIYRVVLTKSQRPKPVVLITGRTLDRKTNQPIAADILYEDLSTGQSIGVARSDAKSGGYQIALPAGLNYGYVARAQDYYGISANLDLSKLSEYKEIKQDLYLAKREVGAVVRLNNLFFDFDKAELKPESYPELKRVIRYMQQNKTVVLEIDGHTDSVGTKDYNQNLSQQRAMAVRSYLVTNGADDSRLTATAFGEDKPEAPNGTQEGRAVNRRVEFVIKKL